LALFGNIASGIKPSVGLELKNLAGYATMQDQQALDKQTHWVKKNKGCSAGGAEKRRRN